MKAGLQIRETRSSLHSHYDSTSAEDTTDNKTKIETKMKTAALLPHSASIALKLFSDVIQKQITRNDLLA